MAILLKGANYWGSYWHTRRLFWREIEYKGALYHMIDRGRRRHSHLTLDVGVRLRADCPRNELPEPNFYNQRSDSMEVSELIALYNRAWSEPDYALRQKLLEQIWADDGTYTDPTAHVAGRNALVDHIGALFEQFPGAYFVVTSGIDSHHGKFRFTWRMVLADGEVFLEGVDFGELNSDGKLHRIVGFFGPLVLKP